MISNMNWQVIRLDDVKPTPWRNGGGTTRELIAWPSSHDWEWRASVAEVSQSGSFSSFPGVQRWFAVLSGDGVGLTVNGQLYELHQIDQPLRFDGAAKTHCELLSGATQDFNLMVHSGRAARMQRVRTELRMMIDTPKIIALYAVNTPATLCFYRQEYILEPHSFGFISVGAETAIELSATNALLMEIEL